MSHADCTALTEFWFDHNKLATMHQLEVLTEWMPCKMQHGTWHAACNMERGMQLEQRKKQGNLLTSRRVQS